MLYGLHYLGVRRGELLGLRWEDVDWQSNTVHVQRDVDFAAGGSIGDLKTSAADRHIPLMSDFRQILAANRSLPQYYIFHGRDPIYPLCESTFRRKWRSLRAELGFDITPHWLRHNFISLCYDAGIKAEETMRM